MQAPGKAFAHTRFNVVSPDETTAATVGNAVGAAQKTMYRAVVAIYLLGYGEIERFLIGRPTTAATWEVIGYNGFLQCGGVHGDESLTLGRNSLVEHL